MSSDNTKEIGGGQSKELRVGPSPVSAFLRGGNWGFLWARMPLLFALRANETHPLLNECILFLNPFLGFLPLYSDVLAKRKSM